MSSYLAYRPLLLAMLASAMVTGCSDDEAGGASDLIDASPLDARASLDQDSVRVTDGQGLQDLGLQTIPLDPDRTAFALPIHREDRHQIQTSLIVGVDHDPTSDGALICRSYDGRGFPACYDGHDGTDFIVWGGFDTIDVEDVRVVAAAPGVVTRIEDGNYDRCHGDLGSGDVSCDGHPVRSNRIHIRHQDGLESRYLHLKRGSLAVDEGDVVACGQLLALVGSSGRSAAPHLHFEVQSDDGEIIDPFATVVRGADSYWTEQSIADGMPGSVCTR